MFLRTLTSSLARRPKRFAVAVLAVAMGVGIAVALASVSLVLGDRLGRTVRAYGANLVVAPEGAQATVEIAGTDVVAVPGAGRLSDSTLTTLKAFRWRNNVLGFAPQSYATAQVAPNWADSRTIRVPLVGTWFDRELRGPDGVAYRACMATIAPWWKVTGCTPVPGASEILVGRA